MILSKKSVLSVSLFILILWGVVLSTFANPPTSPYAVSQNITDPACAPSSLNCYVANISIGDTVGNSPDQNGILYTNATGQVTTDPLFTRDSVTKETNIAKDFNVAVTSVELTLSNVITIDPSDFSGPFFPGDSLVGATSGATATLDYYNPANGFAYLSNVVGSFQNGEVINDITAGESSIVGQSFPITPFAVNDTIKLYSMSSSSIVAYGTVTAVSGNVYTVQIQSATGVPVQYDIALDNLSGTTKFLGIINFTVLPSGSITTQGTVHVGSILGGLASGVANYYGDQINNRFALNFVGTGFGTGDTYSSGTIVADVAKNNFATIIQDLYSDIDGTPELQLSTIDASNGYNSNIVMNGNRMILQNNQVIALLGRIQIGNFDYNNDTPSDPYPAFPDYYYLPSARGSAGQVLTDDGNGNTFWQTLAPGSLDWSLTGNSGTIPGTHFIGTTDAQDFVIKTNNQQTGRIFADGTAIHFGIGAGGGSASTNGTKFFGQGAGDGATGAYNANFFGYYAGSGATGAYESTFLQSNAGTNATNAHDSFFFGHDSGYGATNASFSNFLGNFAGQNAINAENANFMGQYAGYNATNAHESNFFGISAGYNAIGADSSNFLGIEAGNGATNANNSNFIGSSAGSNAISANHSNFIGFSAGSNGSNASYSNFFGSNAGENATDAHHSNFLGLQSGFNSPNATNSNFLGLQAGQNATNASSSNFIGELAGFDATDAGSANFIGSNAGRNASLAAGSNFIGISAGMDATNASYSTFIGLFSGRNATNSSDSVFIGSHSGRYQSTTGTGTQNAAHSIFIGNNAGYSSADNALNNTTNPDDFSILLGNNTSTGGFSNSIAIGGSAVNTASNQFMIGSATRPIDTLVLTGSAGNTCVLDVTVASPSCSSDETLKTDITDLSTTTLENLLKVKTVTYNWKNYPDKGSQIGFLAQDLEQYFPEVVSTAPNGFKTVSYGGMAPILVEAVRELDLKITNLTNPTDPSSIAEKIIAKLIKADRIETKELCVDDVCVTRDQFFQMVQSFGQTPSITPPTDPTPTTLDPLTCTAPQVLNQTGDACVDPVAETPEEIPTVEEPSTPTE